MRIVSVVGTRPQLIKAAVLLPVLRARHEEIFVDTGQHYDEAMAGSFFAELGLPRPDHSLGVGGGTHAQQTAAMLTALEPILDRRPTGCRAGLRRYQLDPGRRARGGQAERAGRPCRGGLAVLRSADAGRDQPGHHRPHLALALRADARRRREPRARGRDRGRRAGRRPHAGPGRPDRARGARSRCIARRSVARVRAGARRLPVLDHPSRREQDAGRDPIMGHDAAHGRAAGTARRAGAPPRHASRARAIG